MYVKVRCGAVSDFNEHGGRDGGAGADSLADDRLGPFMLSLDGHAAAVKFMKKFKKPMLVCGGGLPAR